MDWKKNLEKMTNKAPQNVRENLTTIGGLKNANLWN